MEITTEQIQRFWAKVNKTESCWLWTGCVYRKKSRATGIFKTASGRYSVKQIAWFLAGRPQASFLNNICENDLCCNPAHLFPPHTKESWLARRRADWAAKHPRMTWQERFWSKVQKAGPDDCWLWKAGAKSGGYGIFRLNGKNFGAHVIALSIELKRPIAGWALHECDNPPCCNPKHLFEGDHLANMRDCASKGRNSRGESHGNSKLKTEQVVSIKQLDRSVSNRAAAGLFGVSTASISMIRNGARWKHVQI